MLEMVHLSWQAAYEDRFHRVVADQPSVGLIVSTGPHEHVERHSDGCWPASLSEAHGGHTPLCARLPAHVLSSWSHRWMPTPIGVLPDAEEDDRRLQVEENMANG